MNFLHLSISFDFSHSELDPGIEEAIATLIWVTPRLSGDVQEVREVGT